MTKEKELKKELLKGTKLTEEQKELLVLDERILEVFLAGQNSQKEKDLEMIEKSEWIHPKCKKKVTLEIKNGK